jgi:phosphoserine phosphatase RsbU/P
VETIGYPGRLLGMANTADVSESVAVLSPGDMVVLYTDGLSEGRQDRALFGDERIAEVLRVSGGLTAQKTADALVAAVLAFQDGQPRDDIAVVVVKAPPPSRH